MSIVGTQSSYGVPISYNVSYNGTTLDENKIIRIGDVNNSSDPINGNRQVSDLSVSFSDIDGSIWENLGNGTDAFGKSFSATTIIGGTMGYTPSDTGTKWGKTGTSGANLFTAHTGKVVSVSRRKRITTVRSQNQMNLIPRIKWQHPIKASDRHSMGSFYGSYSFVSSSIDIDALYDDYLDNAGWDFNEDSTGWNFYGVPNSSAIDLDDYQGTGIYDTDSGTGIVDFLSSTYQFVDSVFYREFTGFIFKGTKFGRLTGTINSNDKAKKYGYDNLADAESNLTKSAVGTFYDIDKIRYEWPLSADDTKPTMHQAQNMSLSGDPTAILRHLLFGKMVTDYFTQSEDMAQPSFESAAIITAYQSYIQNILASESNQSIEDNLNDILLGVNALFFVDTFNKFNFDPYGPQDLTQSLDSLSDSDVIEASFSNDTNDYYNRINIEYGWNENLSEFSKSTQGTLDSWDIESDRLYTLKTKWIQNDNNANSLRDRFLARFKNTFPKISFTTSLQQSGRELGSLVSVSESDTGMDNKVLQLVGYKKGFSNSKQVVFQAYDGESLFYRKGYAKWEGDGVLDAVVSGTSLSGWGTEIGGIGTCFNINEGTFGTTFNWW